MKDYQHLILTKPLSSHAALINQDDDLQDARILDAAEDLDDGAAVLVLDGVVQLIDQVLVVGLHQPHDDVLELTLQLPLQVMDQVLTINRMRLMWNNLAL